MMMNWFRVQNRRNQIGPYLATNIMSVNLLLKNKEDILDRLSHAGYRIKRKYNKRNTSSRGLLGDDLIIDADFVEMKKELPDELLLKAGKANSEPIGRESVNGGSKEGGSKGGSPEDGESVENLIEYLKTCSSEELSAIFDELLRIMERKGAGSKCPRGAGTGTRGGKKERVREISQNVFENLSRAALRGGSKIKDVSKSAGSKASRLAHDNKDSVKEASEKIYCRLRYSSPEERKMILMFLVQVIILKKPTLAKNPAFILLLQSLSNSILSREDVEKLVKGISKLLKRRT